jgi:hypothetical protein
VPTTPDPDSWQDVADKGQLLQLIDSSTGQFRIGMSPKKMSGLRDGSLRGSHVARRLKGGANLKVFGNMDKTRYIKPFVVWWD